jgi:putative membrane protein
MKIVSATLVGLVAALHVYFLVLEMFLWRTPFGRKTFGTTAEVAEASAVLAANQGLYNGFLAAGLVFALARGERPMLLFMLGCVIAAGVYGAATANRKILFVQAVPAALALGATVVAH